MEGSAQAQAPGYRPYPPPGYGPAPGYAPYGRPAYPPPAAYYKKPDGPPLVFYGWDPDVPPPDGYDLRSTPNGRLIGFGVGMFSIGYVTACFAGLVAVSDERSAEADDWYPLFIPVVGPFMGIGSLDASAAETGVLLADGLLQAGGLAAIIVGAMDSRYKLVRTQVGGKDGPTLEVVPTVGTRANGLAAHMRF